MAAKTVSEIIGSGSSHHRRRGRESGIWGETIPAVKISSDCTLPVTDQSKESTGGIRDVGGNQDSDDEEEAEI